MKVNVLKEFRDKYSGELYKKGSTIEMSEKRFKEVRDKNSSLVCEATEDAQRAVDAEVVETVTEEVKKAPVKRRRSRKGNA